jgi:hypothetical protein
MDKHSSLFSGQIGVEFLPRAPVKPPYVKVGFSHFFSVTKNWSASQKNYFLMRPKCYKSFFLEKQIGI